MALFYQEDINQTTRLGIWKIEEGEAFFIARVPVHNQVTHPHKRLQHLAGRFLLQFLFPDFPYDLIAIADTKKPYLVNEAYHFSISHCGNYAAAIVSKNMRVGIDIEEPKETVLRIQQKFVSEAEYENLKPQTLQDFTTIWSAKEAVFKWYGLGEVDFKKHIQLVKKHTSGNLECIFAKTDTHLEVNTKDFGDMVLSFVIS